MNAGSVITNWETNEKYGWGSPVTFPQFSILDPVHTTSVPKDRNNLRYGRYYVARIRTIFPSWNEYRTTRSLL